MGSLLNPWAFHLQKLGLELKCPLCLNLLNKPILLPCNHIFCKPCIPKSSQYGSDCPACQNHFTDQERRPASFMENIVAIFRSVDATFNATIFPLFSSESGKQFDHSPVSVLTSNIQLRRKANETSPREGNKQSGVSLVNFVQDGVDSPEKTDKSGLLSNGWNGNFDKKGGCGMVLEDGGDQVSPIQSSDCKGNFSPVELGVNRVSGLSPGSSPSFSGDAKDVNGCTDIGSRNGSTEKHTAKRSVGNNLDTAAGGVDKRDVKRQKKLNYGLSAKNLQSTGYSPQIVPNLDNLAVSNCNEEPKFRNDRSVSPSTALTDVNVNNSPCAFCHSSETTDGTGPLLHYADGEEVTGSINTVSKAIPVHSKCIEWSPQVYYVGEAIKNLEPELARAAKLKCSVCGLRGAALGCFAKSCRRSYHIPCALKVPGCRWDCDDFLMLCPYHKSTKFPKEKSRSKKYQRGESYSLSPQSSPDQLNFWATSPNEPKEIVLCGSTLSSKEKNLLMKFATISGATVSKSWNPNITHVIAATDEKGACSRTLKVLMAILNGRWILTVDWVKACLEANHPVNEEPYEINLDNHGCHDGPKNGRLRASTNAPKVFNGYKFYFCGDFVPAYRIDLIDLVTVGGGAVIETKEQLMVERYNDRAISTFLVAYNQDAPEGCMAEEVSSSLLRRFEEADIIGTETGSLVIPHTWILETIAASRLLPSTSAQPLQ